MITVKELIAKLAEEDQNTVIVSGMFFDDASTLLLYVEGGEDEDPIEIDI